MKIQRLILNAESSLAYFYSHNFKFDNFNFLDLNLSICKHEQEDFRIEEKMKCNRELYFKCYAQCLKVIFHETKRDGEIARRRYPYMYIITKFIHMLFYLTAFKLFSVLIKRLIQY